MIEFFHDLVEPQNGFLRIALFTGLLAGIACGIVGTYVVTRRITYMAGSIAHCVLGGMGAARYCQTVLGWQWAAPMYGAVASALVAAAIIGYVSLRSKEREDTIIGALWAIGMAIGILFIHKTPGYEQELKTYLVGNILMVSRSDLWLLIVLDGIITLCGLMFYKQLLAVCFDEEYARLRGLRVELYFLLLLCLTALTVVLLVSVVGIIMVIALITLPVAISGRFCRTLWQIMLVASVLSMVFTTSGLGLSHSLDLPAGATTIVLAGATYLIALAGGRIVRRKSA